jgi:hypothetical protein
MILFRHTCPKATHKIEVDNLDRLHSGHGNVVMYGFCFPRRKMR